MRYDGLIEKGAMVRCVISDMADFLFKKFLKAKFSRWCSRMLLYFVEVKQ